MNRFPHVKVSFLATLKVRHSKHGARSVIDKLIMSNIEKLTFSAETDDVLDVGCGTGYGSVLIGSRVRSVLGIETDSSKLAVASKDYPADNVTYMRVDSLENFGENASKWRESFDKAISVCALYFVHDMEAVLRNIYDSLKPGGESLIITPHDDYNFFRGSSAYILDHKEWSSFVQGVKNPVSIWERNEEETRDFFKASGWSYVSCEIQRFKINLSEEKAKLILWDMVDLVDKVDGPKRDECLDELWQWALRKYEPAEEEGIIKPADIMVIHARK